MRDASSYDEHMLQQEINQDENEESADAKPDLIAACHEAIILIENTGRGTNRERNIVRQLRAAINKATRGTV